MDKELQLDKRTIDIVLNIIKAHIDPDLDIMGFYGYDYETQEYGFWYKGPGNPTEADFKLARVYMGIKQTYQYHAGLGISFDMDTTGE